jgi:phosphoribosylanthranilate isomerase
VKVKICGITRLEDGLTAAQAGADLLGFNFYPGSPRYLEIPHCRVIADAVRQAHPGVKLVGVFVNADPDVITHTLATCGLDFAQLTGEDTLVRAAVTLLGPSAFPALRLSTLDETALPFLSDKRGGDAPAFLIDAHLPGMYGGTGQLADWDVAAALAARFPILLAGGLKADNVRAAIARVNPWGVDVASGVENAPGIKDHDQVRLFIHHAKTASIANH